MHHFCLEPCWFLNTIFQLMKLPSSATGCKKYVDPMRPRQPITKFLSWYNGTSVAVNVLDGALQFGRFLFIYLIGRPNYKTKILIDIKYLAQFNIKQLIVNQHLIKISR